MLGFHLEIKWVMKICKFQHKVECFNLQFSSYVSIEIQFFMAKSAFEMGVNFQCKQKLTVLNLYINFLSHDLTLQSSPPLFINQSQSSNVDRLKRMWMFQRYLNWPITKNQQISQSECWLHKINQSEGTFHLVVYLC